MSSRSSRTSSIPIPTAAVNVRSIENVISIPSSSSTSYSRTRLPSTPSLAAPASPTLARSVPRSASLSVSRSSFRQQFEPRVVRAGPQPQDTACPPISPTSSRRATFGGYTGPGPALAAARPRAPSSHSIIPIQPVPSSETFARPAYLDSSTFRDSLVTEAPPPLVPARKVDGASSGPPGSSRSYSASVPTALTSDSDEESITSPPPQPRPVPFAPVAGSSSSSQAPAYKLPTRWNNEDRHNFLSISADGREIVYNGSSTNGDKDGATVRANHPIPPVCGIYYYEVEILGKEQKSHVSIGFAGPSVKVSRLPGWEVNSWGYHGDDGCSFAAERNGTQYSHTYGSGDKVGCGIDFSTRRAFYTKNGQLLGPVFENVGKGIDLYPAIGLQHAQECVRVNFGQDPFHFDIENHAQQQKLKIWSTIMDTPLHRTPSIAAASGTPPSKEPISEGESKDMLSKLVLSYLVHHGYAKTVRAFDKQLRSAAKAKESDADVEMDAASPVKESSSSSSFESLEDDIERRKRIVNAVVDGDLDQAIKETQEHHPAVLEADSGIMRFKLRCRKFVEMVLATAEMKKGMAQMEQGDKLSAGRSPTATSSKFSSIVEGDWLQDDMDMDVDDDAAGGYGGPTSKSNRGAPKSPTTPPAKLQLEAALTEAINYGQAISDEYKNDSREEVQTLFKKTFGILAWDQPTQGGEVVAAFVSKETRITLANELNQAILKSQGRPAKPLLETLYRHTSACVTQLGLLGEGQAAFADMNRELLDV
ncbi:ran-binding protein 10 [Coprinopsis sp. MPI-PUGE-AT-0042]|nr:ran-binding protein 10 [Coprinopsis sp. MPI-PUGE-AT-0042]